MLSAVVRYWRNHTKPKNQEISLLNIISIDDLATAILSLSRDIIDDNNWGERALFYNPGQRLKKGRYVATFKFRDGANDKASALGADGRRYRLNLGIEAKEYFRLFGPRPERPAAGGVVTFNGDFTKANVLTPHPVYAWMGWISIIDPQTEMWPQLIELAHSALLRASNN
jgi:hypothetical protein